MEVGGVGRRRGQIEKSVVWGEVVTVINPREVVQEGVCEEGS